MRENNRNSIEKCRKKLPQFTTMNVIDGQAGLIIYTSLIFYSLTIDNILNIIILLILAAVSIATLTGENGLLVKVDNGKTITNADNTAIINSEGSLDIQNGTIIGTYSEKVASICIGENAVVNLSNTTVDRNSDEECSWETIELHGKLSVDSGKISSPNCCAICGYGGATLEISETVEITATGNPPTIYLDDGDIANISGGKITAENSNAIYNYSGTVNISGGDVIGDSVIYSYGNLYINGGHLESTYNASGIEMKSDTAEFIITGGDFIGGIRFTNNLTITGGNFTGWSDLLCSFSDGAVLNIGSPEDEFNISNPSFVSGNEDIVTHAIRLTGENSILNFYNGIIKGTKGIFENQIPTINCREGYTIKYSTEGEYQVAYLEKE